MHKRKRTITTWLLMLVIMLSPVQVSLAQKAAPHEHPPACQDMHGHSLSHAEQGMSDHCDSGHSDLCIDHPHCLAQLTFTSLQPVSALSLAGRIAQSLRFTRSQSNVPSRFPDSLTRPPNS